MWNTKLTHWWWMCLEVALWSAKRKKWDVLVWRSGTIRHFDHVSQSLSDVRNVCCGEGRHRVAKHRLIPLKLWFGLPLVMNRTRVKVTEECRRRKRDSLVGMKTAPIEGKQTYCVPCHCAFIIVWMSMKKYKFSRPGMQIRVEWKPNIWPKPSIYVLLKPSICTF